LNSQRGPGRLSHASRCCIRLSWGIIHRQCFLMLPSFVLPYLPLSTHLPKIASLSIECDQIHSSECLTKERCGWSELVIQFFRIPNQPSAFSAVCQALSLPDPVGDPNANGLRNWIDSILHAQTATELHLGSHPTDPLNSPHPSCLGFLKGKAGTLNP
jgi:hypothetical protein